MTTSSTTTSKIAAANATKHHRGEQLDGKRRWSPDHLGVNCGTDIVEQFRCRARPGLRATPVHSPSRSGADVKIVSLPWGLARPVAALPLCKKSRQQPLTGSGRYC